MCVSVCLCARMYVHGCVSCFSLWSQMFIRAFFKYLWEYDADRLPENRKLLYVVLTGSHEGARGRRRGGERGYTSY